MFKALDRVRYDSLKLNEGKDKSKNTSVKVKSLVDLSCTALNWYSFLLDDGVGALPIHLVPKLIQIAIDNNQALAISTIIANWPLDTLRFTELFEDVMDVVCFYVFEGVTSRTKKCKLRCLDFRGITLNPTFCKLIVQTWPLLSLKKSQLKPKKLAKVIATAAGVGWGKLTDDIIPKILEERLNNDIIKNADSRIVLPRGQRMEVKMDSAQFTTNNMFFMDYMICNCLRSITPVYLTFSNIYIKSELVEGDVITDSLAPFLVLKGQDTKSLEGLSLRQLEEGIFFIISSDIQKFTNLLSLDMQDCNIYLQEGITRSRTLARTHLSQTLNCFTHLRRLDISFNYLLGCLGELLDALQCPLDFLSVRGCDLNERDLTLLSQSKHAPHLKELNLSKLCQFSIYESDRISPSYLMKILKHFPELVVLNVSQNHLPDVGILEFCDILNTLTQLKGLDIAGNIMQFEHQLNVVRACAKLPTMQWLRLTCVNNMMNDGIMFPNNQIGEMWSRFRDLLKSLGRDDICVDVVRLSFAILVDLIDIFD